MNERNSHDMILNSWMIRLWEIHNIVCCCVKMLLFIEIMIVKEEAIWLSKSMSLSKVKYGYESLFRYL